MVRQKNQHPISQREADAILARVRNTGEAPRPKRCLNLVKNYSLLMVRSLTLKGRGGSSVRKSRLTLTINVFNRPTQVELSFDKSKNDLI